MSQPEHMPMKDMEVYKRYAKLADEIWDIVVAWDYFAKKTVGEQLVTAADSMGANLMEGDGRYGTGDPLRFFYYTRGSAKETEYWLDRCLERKLMSKETIADFKLRLISANQLLNRLINYRRSVASQWKVKDSAVAEYHVTDGAVGELDFDPSQN